LVCSTSASTSPNPSARAGRGAFARQHRDAQAGGHPACHGVDAAPFGARLQPLLTALKSATQRKTA